MKGIASLLATVCLMIVLNLFLGDMSEKLLAVINRWANKRCHRLAEDKRKKIVEFIRSHDIRELCFINIAEGTSEEEIRQSGEEIKKLLIGMVNQRVFI